MLESIVPFSLYVEKKNVKLKDSRLFAFGLAKLAAQIQLQRKLASSFKQLDLISECCQSLMSNDKKNIMHISKQEQIPYTEIMQC